MTLSRREWLARASALAWAGWLPRFGRAESVPAAVARPAGWSAYPLLEADLSKSLDRKNLRKPVHATQVIDDMESDSGWVSSDAVTLSYTSDRSRRGTRSLRFRTLLRNEDYIRSARQENGSFTGQAVLFPGQPGAAAASLRLDPPQDWSAYNRLSVWCYVHPTANPTNSLSIQFLCEGADAGPTDPISAHYFADLEPGKWNQLAWEIPEHRRDRVSRVDIFQTLSGVSLRGADAEIVYDFDALCLERVDAERVAGWAVTPGVIAYSHPGYAVAGQKVAIAAQGSDRFQILGPISDDVIAEFPAATVENDRGAFSVLDFSAFDRKGSWRLRHSDAVTAAFEIADSPWRGVAEATLNAFYGMRCGCPVPGVHEACHLDVFVEHEGERRVVGGGWHDAANLTQGPYRTHLSIYALLELHEALREQGAHDLAERALEEALWGIDWSLRMRFGPGLRALYGVYSYWTDGLPGTLDDVVQQGGRGGVGRNPFQNTLAVLAAARAARTLKSRDPDLAARLLQAAREDFGDVLSAIAPPREAPALGINEPSWRDQIGYLTLAAVELHRATDDAAFATEAARLARWLVETQERRFVDGIAVTGYFYEDAGRTRLVHEFHNSFEDSGLLAFAALCEALPDHPDWMQWYAGLSLYAEYFAARGATASAPFQVLPAAVWRRSDIDAPLAADPTGGRLAAEPSPLFPTFPRPELVREQMLKQFEEGTWLGPDHRLRVFPLWLDHVRHGATNVQLGKAIGVAAAAGVLNRADLSELVTRQLEWVLGLNPFSRSLVYGVGNDWWQNFTVALPNFVGGLSLGFNCYTDDAPAWGNNAVFPYKELWVYSLCRIAHVLARVTRPAGVTGRAAAAAEIRNLRTGAIGNVPRGPFELRLAAGMYEVTSGALARTLAVADGARLQLNLDQALWIRLSEVSRKLTSEGVLIELAVDGSGRHTLTARVFNAELSGFPDAVDPAETHRLQILIRASDPESPWLVALVPDDRLDDRFELNGGAPSWPSRRTES